MPRAPSLLGRRPSRASPIALHPAFLLRRELDGSATAFTVALEELVSLYDAAWLRDGAGIVKAAASAAPSAAPTVAPEPAAGTPVGPDARICGAVVEQLSASPTRS